MFRVNNLSSTPPTELPLVTPAYRPSSPSGNQSDQRHHPKNMAESGKHHAALFLNPLKDPTVDSAAVEKVLQDMEKIDKEDNIKATVQAFRTELRAARQNKNNARYHIFQECLEQWLSKHASGDAPATLMQTGLEKMLWEELLLQSVGTSDTLQKSAIDAMCRLLDKTSASSIPDFGKCLIEGLQNKSHEVQTSILDAVFSTAMKFFVEMQKPKNMEKIEKAIHCLPEWAQMINDRASPLFIKGEDFFGSYVSNKHYSVFHKDMVSQANETRTPPAPEDKVPCMPSECMMHWISAIDSLLGNEKESSLTEEQHNFLKETKTDAGKRTWLQHDMTYINAIDYFHEKQKEFASTFPSLAKLANGLTEELSHLDLVEQWDAVVNIHRQKPDLSSKKKGKLASLFMKSQGQKKLDSPIKHILDAKKHLENAGLMDLAEYAEETADLYHHNPLRQWVTLLEIYCSDDQKKPESEQLSKDHEKLVGNLLKEAKNQIETRDSKTSTFFKNAKEICTNEFPELAEWADRLQKQCTSSKNFHTLSNLLPRLNDSIYPRIFESHLMERLLTHPLSEEEKRSAAEFSRAWRDIFTNIEKMCGVNALNDILNKFTDEFGNKNPRAWYPKTPSFHSFIVASDSAQMKEKLMKFLDNDKETGFDDAALSLLGYMSVFIHEAGISDLISWFTECHMTNKNFIQNENSRIAIYSENPPVDKDIGITLGHHIPAIQGQDLESGKRSIRRNKMNTAEPSSTLREVLSHGIATGGLSGSANLKLHMVDHFRSAGYAIDYKYAFQ